jgi:hypothetical protein
MNRNILVIKLYIDHTSIPTKKLTVSRLEEDIS